jgi:uncharacterized protein YjbI with pentapeptide repeats
MNNIHFSQLPYHRILRKKIYRKSDSAELRSDKEYFEYKGLYFPIFEDNIDLSGISFHGTVFVNAIMKNIDLSSCKFDNTEFYNSNLENSTFDIPPSSLTYTSLSFNIKQLVDIHFEESILCGVNFSKIEMKNSRFISCDLSASELGPCNFSGTDLTGAFFDDCDLTGCIFAGANLTDVVFNDCDLFDTDFRGAIETNTNYGDSRRVEDIIENRHEQHDGVAYEVHNTFTPLVAKREEYLDIIAQPEPSFKLAKLNEDIYKKFIDEIKRLFPKVPGGINKRDQFTTLYNKFMPSLALMKDETKILVAKSLSFVFSQDDDFKREYINIWLDESFNAYDGPGDTTSCVNGIIERLILTVINAAVALCSDDTKCTSQYEALIKLTKKFEINEVAMEWWDPEYKGRTHLETAEERRNDFIRFLIEKAEEQGFRDEETKQRIRDYAVNSFSEDNYRTLSYGGRRKRVSRKSKKSMKSRKSRKSMKSRKSKKFRNMKIL